MGIFGNGKKEKINNENINELSNRDIISSNEEAIKNLYEKLGKLYYNVIESMDEISSSDECISRLMEETGDVFAQITRLKDQNDSHTEYLGYEANTASGDVGYVTDNQEEQSHFCQYCGEKIAPDSRFCTNCGRQI